MLFKKSKIALVFVLTLISTMLLNYSVEAKETEVNKTYNASKVIQKQVTTSYDKNDKVAKVETIKYDAKGKKKTLQVVTYKDGKKLTDFSYTYKGSKQLNSKRVYYYNIHTNKKVPGKKYVTKTYDKNGKIKKTTFYTKAAKQAEVAAIAKKQVGKKYLYGGNTTKGFDCSGLTSYVYKTAITKNIGRATSNQVKGKTIKISEKTLQKGDLLFFGSKSSPYHVGVYIGDGKYVHASTPQTGVKIEKISNAYFKPSFAKRVL